MVFSLVRHPSYTPQHTSDDQPPSPDGNQPHTEPTTNQQPKDPATTASTPLRPTQKATDLEPLLRFDRHAIAPALGQELACLSLLRLGPEPVHGIRLQQAADQLACVVGHVVWELDRAREQPLVGFPARSARVSGCG
eukprot:3102950-Rhodomonas_salina.1